MAAKLGNKTDFGLMPKLSRAHARERKEVEWWQMEVDREIIKTRQEEVQSHSHAQIHARRYMLSHTRLKLELIF